MISKKDIIAQAQSGTGKTGCFTIGTLELTDETYKNTGYYHSPYQRIIISNKNVIDSLERVLKN